MSFFSRCRARQFASRLFLQKSDDVGAILRIIDREHHLGSGDEGLWMGEPLVERGFVPDDVRSLQWSRVIVVRNAAGRAAEDIVMTGADPVLVERMADHALAVDRGAMSRIARREARRRMCDHEHDSHGADPTLQSTNASARTLSAAGYRVHLLLRAGPAVCRSDDGVIAQTREEIAKRFGLFPRPADNLP